MSAILKGDLEARPKGAASLGSARAELFTLIPSKKAAWPSSEWIAGDGLEPSRSSRIYAEGFQMLSLQEGTIGQRIFAGRCPDDDLPYRHDPLKGPVREAYGIAAFENSRGGWTLLGFTTCSASKGRFLIDASSCRVEVSLGISDGQGRIPGQALEGEGFCQIASEDLQSALSLFASIAGRGRPASKRPPMGWCSWYSRYEKVTEEYVRDSLEVLKTLPELDCVLIDDGYQEHMGDWLSFSGKFPRGLGGICSDIRDASKVPGIWLAPMIASGASALAREHPQWLARNPGGGIASASDLTYGGWRDLPWLTLDYGNPEVRKWMASVVRELRRKYGIRLFKLDSLYWGAYEGLSFSTPMTGVMNVRLALQAIREGAGEDSFILGCNAPLWACSGLVDGMRVADDAARNARVFAANSEACSLRSWMNRSMWLNDPDCLLLCDLGDQRASEGEYAFHLGSILASDGIFMSGDDLTAMSEERLDLLRRAAEVAAAPKKVVWSQDRQSAEILMPSLGKAIAVALNRSSLAHDFAMPQGTDFMNLHGSGGTMRIPPLCGALVEHQCPGSI